MPRYHLKIKGSNLRGVKKEVRITVKGREQAELTVELNAKNAKAAKDLVKARVPTGSGASVGNPVRLKD